MFASVKRLELLFFLSNLGYFTDRRRYLYRHLMLLPKPRLPWRPAFGLRMLFLLTFGPLKMANLTDLLLRTVNHLVDSGWALVIKLLHDRNFELII